MIRCAVVGATGYTGVELAKCLLRHPRAEITGLTTRQKKAVPLRTFLPSHSEAELYSIEPYQFEKVKKDADVVFLCLPHKEAMQTGAKFYHAGKLVIDLSADFRLRDYRIYEKWYGVKHTQRALLEKAVYGLPEISRAKIKRADLIANPGCYPTSAILGIYPLLKDKLVEPNAIVVDAKSGVSGAGRVSGHQ